MDMFLGRGNANGEKSPTKRPRTHSTASSEDAFLSKFRELGDALVYACREEARRCSSGSKHCNILTIETFEK